MDRQHFAENVCRLLGSFYKNLLAEAKSEAEKAVAGLLRRRQGRLWISQRLIIEIEKAQEQVESNEAAGVATEHEHDLGTWLANISEVPADLPEEELDADDSSNESTDIDAQNEFSLTSELKQYLRTSTSLKSLHRDFTLWLLPTDIRQVLLSIPKSNI